MALPLELSGASSDTCRLEADRRLEMVGLGDAAEFLPAALSGGMRMRAAVARAFIADPNLLLLDEPFAALDEVTRLRLDEEVASLVRKRSITALLVTHSIAEAVFLADEVVVLSHRPARLTQPPCCRYCSASGSPNGRAPASSFGGRVDAETRKMKMPGCRVDGRRYDSVRAGPHRPFLSGPGDGGGVYADLQSDVSVGVRASIARMLAMTQQLATLTTYCHRRARDRLDQ